MLIGPLLDVLPEHFELWMQSLDEDRVETLVANSAYPRFRLILNSLPGYCASPMGQFTTAIVIMTKH